MNQPTKTAQQPPWRLIGNGSRRPIHASSAIRLLIGWFGWQKVGRAGRGGAVRKECQSIDIPVGWVKIPSLYADRCLLDRQLIEWPKPTDS
ncbi:unnamed protein product [Soboliphyme baturini]|uniref:Transposase n=1 Tax=Soboliphyme baturini TaxID=241478 RepID=A0A183IAV1_9BILA|nr:unnamed protein product [Soboliphyme baturini]